MVLVLAFGPSFTRVRSTIGPRLLVQRGELLLYPWNAFETAIEDKRPQSMIVAPELWRTFHMVGQQRTRQQIAQIFFRRQDLRMWQHRDLDASVDLAIAGPTIFRSWRRQISHLDQTAVYDPSGRIALVQPSKAGRNLGR